MMAYVVNDVGDLFGSPVVNRQPMMVPPRLDERLQRVRP